MGSANQTSSVILDLAQVGSAGDTGISSSGT